MSGIGSFDIHHARQRAQLDSKIGNKDDAVLGVEGKISFEKIFEDIKNDISEDKDFLKIKSYNNKVNHAKSQYEQEQALKHSNPIKAVLNKIGRIDGFDTDNRGLFPGSKG